MGEQYLKLGTELGSFRGTLFSSTLYSVKLYSNVLREGHEHE